MKMRNRVFSYNECWLRYLVGIMSEFSFFISEVLLSDHELNSVHELLILQKDIKETIDGVKFEDLRMDQSVAMLVIFEPQIKLFC